jgi:hypothetical protein
VPLEDVCDMQMQMKKEGSRSIIHINEESGENRSTNFVPKWPRRIVRVMPASSEHGSLFRTAKKKRKTSSKKDLHWILILCLLFCGTCKPS